jgi:hypothetical protein
MTTCANRDDAHTLLLNGPAIGQTSTGRTSRVGPTTCRLRSTPHECYGVFVTICFGCHTFVEFLDIFDPLSRGPISGVLLLGRYDYHGSLSPQIDLQPAQLAGLCFGRTWQIS